MGDQSTNLEDHLTKVDVLQHSNDDISNFDSTKNKNTPDAQHFPKSTSEEKEEGEIEEDNCPLQNAPPSQYKKSDDKASVDISKNNLDEEFSEFQNTAHKETSAKLTDLPSVREDDIEDDDDDDEYFISNKRLKIDESDTNNANSDYVSPLSDEDKRTETLASKDNFDEKLLDDKSCTASDFKAPIRIESDHVEIEVDHDSSSSVLSNYSLSSNSAATVVSDISSGTLTGSLAPCVDSKRSPNSFNETSQLSENATQSKKIDELKSFDKDAEMDNSNEGSENAKNDETLKVPPLKIICSNPNGGLPYIKTGDDSKKNAKNSPELAEKKEDHEIVSLLSSKSEANPVMNNLITSPTSNKPSKSLKIRVTSPNAAQNSKTSSRRATVTNSTSPSKFTQIAASNSSLIATDNSKATININTNGSQTNFNNQQVIVLKLNKVYLRDESITCITFRGEVPQVI